MQFVVRYADIAAYAKTLPAWRTSKEYAEITKAAKESQAKTGLTRFFALPINHLKGLFDLGNARTPSNSGNGSTLVIYSVSTVSALDSYSR